MSIILSGHIFELNIFPQKVSGDMQLYEVVLAQMNLPKTYTAVDLKSDMLFFMRKNQEYIEVSVN